MRTSSGRWFCNQLLLEVTLQVNWINKWNSLRSQGGTVYLSQSSFETHWRIYYIDQHLMGSNPFSAWPTTSTSRHSMTRRQRFAFEHPCFREEECAAIE